jgi:hypothetical protein
MNIDIFLKNNNYNALLWLLIHNSCNKIKNLKENISLLIQNIILPIFKNHPCSYCRNHSIEYLETNNFFNNIDNKIELIIKLFEFHNEINKNLNKDLFKFKNFYKIYEENKMLDIIKAIQQLIIENDLGNQPIREIINKIEICVNENKNLFEF